MSTENTLKKYLIAIPCLDSIPTPTVASLISMRRVGASKVSFLANSLVYDARNMLAAEALDTGAERILWLDSDMVFDVNLMQMLAKDMDEGHDYVTALYFRRHIPTSPVLYKSVDVVKTDDGMRGKTEVYKDYPRNTLFPIAGSGFGAVMTSAEIVKAVYDAFGYPFAPMPGVLGEDLSFCWRARQLGYELFCDSRIKARHVSSITIGEEHYERQEGSKNV